MDDPSKGTDATVSCVMNGKEKVINMGYLVKSPSRNRDKASYAMFWKVRWCVLVQIIYADPLLTAEYSKFLLNYYEDEEHYKQNSAPKGSYFFAISLRPWLISVEQCRS